MLATLAFVVTVATASVASAQVVGVEVITGAEPPVAVTEVRAAVAEAVEAGGARPIEAFDAARAAIGRGAVPHGRLAELSRAEALAARGWRAYLGVDPEFARAQLVAARRAAERSLDLPGGAALYADISLRLGAVLLQLGQRAAARDAFRLARVLDPARAISVADFPPDIVEAVDVAVAQHRPDRRVRLVVRDGAGNALSGARVVVDGRQRAAAPAALALAEGQHVAVARAAGYAAYATAFEIRGDAEIELVLERDAAVAAVLEGPTALAGTRRERDVRVRVEGVIAYGELDALLLVAPAWGRVGPVLLGQRCAGVPARCSRVVEIGFPAPADVGRAARALVAALSGERATLPPLLPVDRRFSAAPPGPGSGPGEREAGCRWCRSPWLWIGVGAAALAGGATWLLVRDPTISPVVEVDPCGFGAC